MTGLLVFGLDDPAVGAAAGEGKRALPQAEPLPEALRKDLRKIYGRIVQVRDAVILGNNGRSGRAEREVFVDGRLSDSRLAEYVAEIDSLAERFSEVSGEPVKGRVRRGASAAETVRSMIRVLDKLHWVRSPLIRSEGFEGLSETRWFEETYPFAVREKGQEAEAAYVRSRLAGGYASWWPRLSRPKPDTLFSGGDRGTGSRLLVDSGALSLVAALHRSVFTARYAGPAREVRLFLVPPTKCGDHAFCEGTVGPLRSGSFIEHEVMVFLDVRKPTVFRDPKWGGPDYRSGLPTGELITGRLRSSERHEGSRAVRASLPAGFRASGMLYFTFVGFEDLERLQLWSYDRKSGFRYLTGDTNTVRIEEAGPGRSGLRSFVLLRVV